MDYFFPFGQKLNRVEQVDRIPKEIFVLGVYASAVHAKWTCNNVTMCKALAVASEPCIFWDGNDNDAKRIIDEIRIPSELGELVPPEKRFNGPSASFLEEHILKPLGMDRSKSWLCDLLPESRRNKLQKTAIERAYNPLILKYNLNEVTIPLEPKIFCDENRRKQITKEIKESKARRLILLGDVPIKQYLKYVAKIDYKSLRDYTKKYGYGKPNIAVIEGMEIEIIPVAHPGQIGTLGVPRDPFWRDQHKEWEKKLTD